jgi:DNA polymerase IV
VVVKFDPYVPQCISRGELLDPTASYFVVKGAEGVVELGQTPDPSHTSTASQSSLRIKASKRQIVVRSSQKADSYPTEESIPSTYPTEDGVSSSLFEETVEDSFIMPSPGAAAASEPKLTDRFGDALSEAIQETKALAHLPLDEDEETELHGVSGVDDIEHSDADDKSLTMNPEQLQTLKIVSKASALRDKKSLNMNAFQCMDPSANKYTSRNPNARTIQILDEMCRHYDKMQDQWRTLSYRKCIATLKKQTVKITTAEQAAKLPFVGTRLAAKIEEIVLTDRLRKLESTRNDPIDKSLRLFLGVYGAGLAQANKWIQAGYRTLEDLGTKAKLSEIQRIGLEHYDDFNSRIPRTEVEAHGSIVVTALNRIDPEFSATIMGSYRRGAEDSSDIDMILSRPNTSLAAMRTTIFEVLIPHLYKMDFLKASLTSSHSNDSSGSKWHGASCLPTSTVWRRIDFLLVPEREMGAALLYFTGNDIFNRSMRLLARKKGMSLNQKGLYKDVQRGRRGEKLNEGVLVEGRSEKRIFEILGVPWREPHERIC